MPDQYPIPSMDPLAIPADLWFVQFLLYFTFFVHVVMMNVMLGGIFLTAVSEILSRFSANARVKSFQTHLAEKLGHVLPFTISLTVTFGIAPLLFVQVIYGQFFYTSSVLIAWWWILVPAIIVIGYYSLYAYSRGWQQWAGKRVWFILLSLLAFLTIAFIYTNNLTLLQTPEKWRQIYDSTLGRGTSLNLDEPTLWSRYWHTFLSAVALAGLLVMILGIRERSQNEERAQWMVKWGGSWFVLMTVLQAGVGYWYYLAIPADIRIVFQAGSTGTFFWWGNGIFIPGFLLILAARWGKPKPSVVWTGTILILAGTAMKLISRDHLRQAYLRKVNFNISQLHTAPQWSVIVLFLVFLVIGTAILIYVLWRVQKETKEFVKTRN